MLYCGLDIAKKSARFALTSDTEPFRTGDLTAENFDAALSRKISDIVLLAAHCSRRLSGITLTHSPPRR